MFVGWCVFLSLPKQQQSVPTTQWPSIQPAPLLWDSLPPEGVSLAFSYSCSSMWLVLVACSRIGGVVGKAQALGTEFVHQILATYT